MDPPTPAATLSPVGDADQTLCSRNFTEAPLSFNLVRETMQ